jgi:hypothetical protein
MCIRKVVKKVVTGKVWVKKREERGGVEGRPFAKGLREGKDEKKREGRKGERGGGEKCFSF